MEVVTLPKLAALPEIEVREELSEVTDEAIAAMEARNGAGLFVRGGVLVRMARQERASADDDSSAAELRRGTGSLFISSAPIAYIREQVDRSATWWRRKYDQARREHVKASALPPSWVAETIAARGEWPFPVLEGVTTTPLLRPDGSILDTPGYDTSTGFYFAPNSEHVSVPSRPTRNDAGRAAVELVEVYRDFPFVADTDRAAALAHPLAILARPAIAGPVPMTAFRAPTPGTGKSMCADAGFLIALGHEAPRSSPSHDDDEMRKHLFSIALSGDAAVLFDDVSGIFGSASLDAALTGMAVEGRILGLSKKATVPMRTVFAVTGNNLGFRGALGRRVVPCDLDAGLEHPEDRTGFAHPDLLGWIAQERPRLVAACLTLLRAYVVEGRPAHPHPPKGSFEAWDRLIRGALVWAGIGDPLGGQDRIREDGDHDLDGLRAGLAAWQMLFGFVPATTALAIKRAATEPEARAGLALFANCDEGRLDARRLGYALRRCKGRLCDGKKFARDGVDRLAGVRWSVLAERTTR